MTDQEFALLGNTRLAASAPSVGTSPTDWTASKVVADVSAHLDAKRQQFVARAPIRLDIMGGAAEYSGSLTVNLNSSEHVCVAVQNNSDGLLNIKTSVDTCTLSMPLSQFLASVNSPLENEQVENLVASCLGESVRSVCGVVAEFARRGFLSDQSDGITVAVGSTLGDGPSTIRQVAPVSAATTTALARLLNATLDWRAATEICRDVEGEWFAIPAGGVEAACCLAGEAYTLTQAHCAPLTLTSTLQLPSDLLFVGIDTQSMRPDADDKFRTVRTTSLMGKEIIRRIIEFENNDSALWNDHLANVTAAEYVARFRDRIPTKIKGRDYLSSLGPLPHLSAEIDPKATYKVRSRCEHHIYENERCHQFIEGLGRAVRMNDRDVLVATGELMYSSHWSYSQRCGLGSIETDMLVNIIRDKGIESGIFGAKISGRGCGGLVVVLTQATDRARTAIQEAISEYNANTQFSAKLIGGSSPGSLTAGAQPI